MHLAEVFIYCWILISVDDVIMKDAWHDLPGSFPTLSFCKEIKYFLKLFINPMNLQLAFSVVSCGKGFLLIFLILLINFTSSVAVKFLLSQTLSKTITTVEFSTLLK